ncbi:MAG: hypothetical protein QOD74_303 [Variibacter sp.]|nr:hypothetical protein [Variibacter sp.]
MALAVMGFLLVAVGIALMFALKPRENGMAQRLKALPASDLIVPIAILTLFIAGGVLLVISADAWL